ncbi:outer membrane protein [Fibrella aquatica]|uniref:outer membrane protein n=1 Tax=Fibrella aquatica TaxID=3242487 RepID=UPI00351FCA5C
MKKLFTLVVGAMVALPTFAQTQKGQSITSGSVNLSFNRGNLDDNKITTYSAGFLVNRGHFVKDNWLFGYTGGFSYTYGEAKSDGLNFTSSITAPSFSVEAGLLLRRYWPILDRLHVYAGGGLGGNLFKSRYNDRAFSGGTIVRESTASSSNWQLRLNGQVGALYTLTNRIAIEAGISNDFPTGLYNANFGVAILAGKQRATTSNLSDFTAPQTQKGRWLLGASASSSGNSQTTEDTGTSRQSTATTGLSAGYFVSNNRLVGLALGYSANRQGNADAPGAVGYAATANLFVRSYMGISRLRPFIEGSGGYGIDRSVASNTVGARHVGASVSAGLAYMAGERFIIQTTLGSLDGRYNWYPTEGEGSVISNYTINARATTLSNISVAYSL